MTVRVRGAAKQGKTGDIGLLCLDPKTAVDRAKAQSSQENALWLTAY